MNGACSSTFKSWGGGGQISLNVNFKDFVYQTLCAFSKIKDINHVEREFILSPGSWPRGGTRGIWWSRVSFSYKHGHAAYQIDGDDK